MWLIVCLWTAYVYIQSRITFPTAEGYEKDWIFQLEMFSFFRLPLLLAALVTALWLSRRWSR
jgi:hypothetical protein